MLPRAKDEAAMTVGGHPSGRARVAATVGAAGVGLAAAALVVAGAAEVMGMDHTEQISASMVQYSGFRLVGALSQRKEVR